MTLDNIKYSLAQTVWFILFNFCCYILSDHDMINICCIHFFSSIDSGIPDKCHKNGGIFVFGYIKKDVLFCLNLVLYAVRYSIKGFRNIFVVHDLHENIYQMEKNIKVATTLKGLIFSRSCQYQLI